MGFLDGIMGNATEVSVENLQKEYADLLVEGEVIEKAYQLIRDMFIFTDKRLILVDKQGISGKKTEYHSLPYKSITHFAVETAGQFDRDAELKIWLSGGYGVQKEFKKGTDILGVQKTLAQYVLG